jgi:plastocyanin
MRVSKLILPVLAGAAVLGALAVAPASGGSGAASPSATRSVSVRDDVFSPRTRTVSRGDKVVWRWRGFNEHNVRFRSAPSGTRRPRGSTTQTSGRFARTFTRRGTYRYVCTIHEDSGMRGRVVVE